MIFFFNIQIFDQKFFYFYKVCAHQRSSTMTKNYFHGSRQPGQKENKLLMVANSFSALTDLFAETQLNKICLAPRIKNLFDRNNSC